MNALPYIHLCQTLVENQVNSFIQRKYASLKKNSKAINIKSKKFENEK